MKPFDYARPTTVREAVSAAADPGAVYLAAGTNLIDLMKGGVTRPDRLVDITHIFGLDRVEDFADGGVRIGALVRNAALGEFDRARRPGPSVSGRSHVGAPTGRLGSPGMPPSRGSRRRIGQTCSPRSDGNALSRSTRDALKTHADQ
jgi:hypothetical protein